MGRTPHGGGGHGKTAPHASVLVAHFTPRVAPTIDAVVVPVAPSHATTTTTATSTRTTNPSLIPVGYRTQERWSRRAWRLIRRMLELSMVSNGAALLCAWMFRLATQPFASGFDDQLPATRATAARHTAATLALLVALGGVVGACLLFAFFLRGRRLAIHQDEHHHNNRRLGLAMATWLVLRLTWRTALGVALVSVSATLLLSVVGFPVVRYNTHTLLPVSAMAMYAVRTIARVVRFRRTHTALEPGERPRVPQPRRRSSASSIAAAWGQSMRFGIAQALPTVLAAVVGTQYVAAGRRLDLTQRATFLWFSGGSVLLKFALQMVAKLLAVKSHGASNFRNLLYMVMAPALIVEIQIRMVLLRVTSQRGGDVTLFAGSAVVGVFEIMLRVVTVVLELLLLRVARRKHDRRKRALRIPMDTIVSVVHQPSSLTKTPTTVTATTTTTTAPVTVVQNDVAALDREFAQWEALQLRFAAVETMAEMVAEYCGIGFACIYAVVLRHSHVYDLGIEDDPQISAWRYLGGQLGTFAVQLAVEIASDLVASTVEMAVGIHVDTAFGREDLDYVRMTVLVSAVYAGGLSLSSLVATGDG